MPGEEGVAHRRVVQYHRMNFTRGRVRDLASSNQPRCGLPGLSAEFESRTRARIPGPILTEYQRYGLRCRIWNAFHQFVETQVLVIRVRSR